MQNFHSDAEFLFKALQTLNTCMKETQCFGQAETFSGPLVYGHNLGRPYLDLTWEAHPLSFLAESYQ